MKSVAIFDPTLLFVSRTISTTTCVVGIKFTKRCSSQRETHLVPVPGICIAKPLDVVEDQPRQGDGHEDDEGDGHKHNGRAAHVFLQVPGTDADVHGHGDVPFQQAYYLLPFGLRNHYSHDVFHTWGERGEEEGSEGWARGGNQSEMFGRALRDGMTFC